MRRWLWVSALLSVIGCRPSGPAERHHVHVKLAPAASAGILAGAGAARPLFDRPAAALARDRVAAERRSGERQPDLGRWWRVPVSGDRARAAAVARRLAAAPGVERAFVEPFIEPAALREQTAERGPSDRSCPVETPSYEPYQGYLVAAPAGIDAPAAWARPGGRGAGVRVADVEGAWNAAHEDLPGERMIDAGGRSMRGRGWEAHGTAVLGVLAARRNGIGMTGIAADLEQLIVASIGDIGAAAAIDRAQARLRPGDMLLIELHGIGPRGRWLPVEYWDDVYDAVRVATGRGVIVIAAAGNGGEDLDHPEYRGRFDRAARDSGAILVGAGAPAAPGFVDRSRLAFSNYGGRVDAQGWGRMVATLDYGDLQGCDAHERKYTQQFSGTSSASPVVVGAAALIQGVRLAAGGEPLAPRAMRALLSATGSPQTDGPSGPATQRIGPRPDLAAALESLGDGSFVE
jgi:subtilisin family serine protease